MLSVDDIFTASVVRCLGDRSYEKRKSAALEIESHIRKIHNGVSESDDGGESVRREQIKKIIQHLIDKFISSQQSNQRKGGLIGLAATSIGLMKETSNFLDQILPAVLSLLKDQEPRVRYYACEALYNITKVTRTQVLPHFNNVFDGLCTLFEDADPDVRNGAALLDRLVKDVVTDCDAFEVDKFIPILTERIRNRHPNVRQLILGWIICLDSVPDIDMMKHLPSYLEGMFEMLNDDEKDLKQESARALSEFLREIQNSTTVSLGEMVRILVSQCKKEESPQVCRLTALQWLSKFILLGKVKLAPQYPDILVAVLVCIHAQEENIKSQAAKTNQELLDLVKATSEASELDVEQLIVVLINSLQSDSVETKTASLRWVSMLLLNLPLGEEQIKNLFPVLLDLLSDKDDKVVELDLEVLARISVNAKYFDLTLTHLTRVLRNKDGLLEKRGKLIIERLSTLLNGEMIYEALAKKLKAEEDLDFCSYMVQTLNLIMLTSPELFELRNLIKQTLSNTKAQKVFCTLFGTWCYNPVSAVCLCLMAQCYELGASLVFRLADQDITIGFLMQMDKLVQLIESPIFIALRLQLLEPKRHPFLLKILYGFLMLLPQSKAFESLRVRLETIAGYGMLNSSMPTSEYARPQRPLGGTESHIQIPKLLEEFEQVQLACQARRIKIQTDKSFQNQKSPPSTAKANRVLGVLDDSKVDDKSSKQPKAIKKTNNR